ncbi:hypothetical protein ACBI99_09920 [Nonomuraea sp. ATR24]|uniref:hypothetical protein n=1 Tax=Nonomuraea sp. ATR24 TaxID=1676744 RepID=UPI0035C13A42
MPPTKIAPPPGASSVAALRARALAARRAARIALTSSIALLCAVQLIAERAPAGQDTLPLAVLALAVTLGAPPALALTQAVWGVRARAVRRRESELYAAPPSPGLALGRLAMAAGWAVLVLLACAVPQLFTAAGHPAPAGALTIPLTVATTATACLAAWWTTARKPGRAASWAPPRSGPAHVGAVPPSASATPSGPAETRAARPGRMGRTGRSGRWAAPRHRDATPRSGPARVGVASRSGGAGRGGRGAASGWAGKVPGDPWDPGRGARTGGWGRVSWACAVAGIVALVGARAHLWDPHVAAVHALLAATLVCGVVTGE